MGRNEVSLDQEESDKLIQNSPVVPVQHTNSSTATVTWCYRKWYFAYVAIGATILSMGFVILMELLSPLIAHSNDVVWVECIIFLIPWFAVVTAHYNRLFQIYFGSATVLFSLWWIPPEGTSVGVGAACTVIAAVAQHVWAHRMDKAAINNSGLGWVLRFTCMIMLTWYVKYMICGSDGRLYLLFSRANFVLQPISVFGFGSFEFIITLTNLVIGWWLSVSIQTLKILPGSLNDLSNAPTLSGKLRLIFTNPIVVLLVLWSLWVISAGIISVTHVPTTSFAVSTVSLPDKGGKITDYIVEEFRAGARIVITAPNIYSEDRCETKQIVGPTCSEAIKSDVVPLIADFGGYTIIGCSSRMIHDGQCRKKSIAMIVHPNGDITPAVSFNKETNEAEYAIINPLDVEGLGPDKVRFAFVSDFAEGPADLEKVVFKYGPNLIFMSGGNDYFRNQFVSRLVVDAIENRVAFVRASTHLGSMIVDPLGQVTARDGEVQERNPAGGKDSFIFRYRTRGEVIVSDTLAGGWIRQQIPYWLAILAYLTYLVWDIIFVIRKRRHDRTN
jgi:hypothetical protein